MEQASSRQKIFLKLKAILPWCFCFAIFAYLFKTIPIAEIRLGLGQLNWPVFLVASFVYFLVILYGDCVGLYYFFKRFVAPVSYKEVLHVRGASFLLSVVNYLLGQAALAYYVKKQYRASLSKALGVVSFVTVMDLLLVVTSGLLALSQSQETQIPNLSWSAQHIGLKVFVAFLWLGYGVWAFFWKTLSPQNLAKLDRYPVLHKLMSHSVFLIFREATAKDYFMLFFMRMPVLIVVLGSINFAFLSFGAQLPWTSVFLFHPIVLLVSSIPLTPAGLGTSQVLLMKFFGGRIIMPEVLWQNVTPAYLVFTASLLWNLANQVYKAIYGGFALYKSKSLRWLEDQSIN